MAPRQLGTGDLDEFRRAGHVLIDAVADHLQGLPGRPVWQPLPDGLRAALLELPLPDRPAGLAALGGTMACDVLPHAMGNGHPAFFGWVNSPPALAGVLASLVAAAMNPSVVSGDHADVHLERTVVRWLAELVGYPHGPGCGLLTSGASAATIVCLAGARGRACATAGRDVRRGGLVREAAPAGLRALRGAQLRAARARAARVQGATVSGWFHWTADVSTRARCGARSRPTALVARRLRCS